MVDGRKKGRKGELEFAKWISEIFNLDYVPDRNYKQCAQSGADFLDIGNFIFEIKRCEKLSLSMWWKQVSKACQNMPSKLPVVVFRQSRREWECLISAQNIGLSGGFIHLPPLETRGWLILGYKKFIENNC